MSSKLRFAPSPTGNLHIGSVRTAIFNWVWAKSLNAKLVLRIEDTDQERSKTEYEENIFDGLDWLGISFDESPRQPIDSLRYRQSERIKENAYQPYIDKLLNSGDAYYCFETDEELDQERKEADEKGVAYMYSRKSLQLPKEEIQSRLENGDPYTIRFKLPDNDILVMNDVIRGKIEFESKLISDFIIVKSDGSPTYNLAVVIDDMEMGITHVVRGEDHISNTPKQIAIFKALKAGIPIFAHLPIILGEDRSKLSKRHGAKSVSEYKEDGFLPEALINYLSLLGWSPPDEKELLSLQELFDLFDISRINKAGAVFDTVKLTWMNKQYLAKKSDDEFLELALPFVQETNKTEDPLVNQKIISVRDNCETLARVNHYLEVYYLSNDQYIQKFKALDLSETDQQVIQELASRINKLENWGQTEVSELMVQLMESLSLGKGKVMKPMRKAITGYDSGPNLVDCLALFSLEIVSERVATAKNYVNTTTSN